LQREWQSGDGAGFSLIWACTPSREVNEAIAQEARRSGAWCGVSGAGSGGDVQGAAAIYRGEVCVGISTGGASPALARHLKARVEAAIGDEYETLLRWMSEARPILKARVLEQSARADVWRQVLASDVLDLLREAREEDARAAFEAIVRGEDEGVAST
jgi:precorrin-2 dehydrogenase/sirohydrochlorin ferrochelatase